jgi:hypothetical protein
VTRRALLGTAGAVLLAASCVLSLGTTLLLGRWLVLAPQGASELLSSRSVPPKPVRGVPFAEAINRTALRHGLDPSLVAAVVAAESDFRPDAVSRRGARGLMQLLPAAWEEVASPACPWESCVFDPAANLEAGSRYLRRLLDRFLQDPRLALAAYNAGPSVVAAYRALPPYPETQGYVWRVGLAWWELRRTGTLGPLSRALLRSLDALPAATAASGVVACSLAALVVRLATRHG